MLIAIPDPNNQSRRKLHEWRICLEFFKTAPLIQLRVSGITKCMAIQAHNTGGDIASSIKHPDVIATAPTHLHQREGKACRVDVP
jgi:hypothetical protein